MWTVMPRRSGLPFLAARLLHHQMFHYNSTRIAGISDQAHPDSTIGSKYTCYRKPTQSPTATPTTATPTMTPTMTPTEHPTTKPPSPSPSHTPTEQPTAVPTATPTQTPTVVAGDYTYDAGSCGTSFSGSYSGSTLGTGSHTFHVYGNFGTYGNSRQWFLNVGQYGTGAEHWLWNGGTSIQFGRWNGGQIGSGSGIATQTSLAWFSTTYDGSSGDYKIYVNGVLQQSTTLGTSQRMDLTSNAFMCGGLEGGWSGCCRKFTMYRSVQSAADVLNFVNAN